MAKASYGKQSGTMHGEYSSIGKIKPINLADYMKRQLKRPEYEVERPKPRYNILPFEREMQQTASTAMPYRLPQARAQDPRYTQSRIADLGSYRNQSAGYGSPEKLRYAA